MPTDAHPPSAPTAGYAATAPGIHAVPAIEEPVEVGRGGFGVVYRARETELERTVAVKVLLSGLDELGMTRFDRERRAMGALSGHPNIVPIYRSGFTADHHPYLVMEYLDGGSMADRLLARGPVRWDRMLEIGVQLAAALETAHRAGVLHRDIKPGNVLISELGDAKLADFGIARLQGAPETQSAIVTASFLHAPPEVLEGKRPTPAADVYSLASTLYQLVVGYAAFARTGEETLLPMLARIASEALPVQNPGTVPPAVHAALAWAMAKDPTHRPASAVAFAEHLAAVQVQLGCHPTPIKVMGDAITSAGSVPPPPVAPTPAPQPVSAPDPVPFPVPTFPGNRDGRADATPQPVVSPPGFSPSVAPRSGMRAGVAAVLGGAVVLLGLVALVALALVAPGTGSEFDTASAALTAGTPPADYDTGYQPVVDDTGVLSFVIPREWGDRQTAPINGVATVRAGTDLRVSEFDTPGAEVLFLAFDERTPATLVSGFASPPCAELFAVQSYEAGGRTGSIVESRFCDGGEAAVVTVALSWGTGNIVVHATLVDERDIVALARLLESLEVFGA